VSTMPLSKRVVAKPTPTPQVPEALGMRGAVIWKYLGETGWVRTAEPELGHWELRDVLTTYRCMLLRMRDWYLPLEWSANREQNSVLTVLFGANDFRCVYTKPALGRQAVAATAAPRHFERTRTALAQLRSVDGDPQAFECARVVAERTLARFEEAGFVPERVVAAPDHEVAFYFFPADSAGQQGKYVRFGCSLDGLAITFEDRNAPAPDIRESGVEPEEIDQAIADAEGFLTKR